MSLPSPFLGGPSAAISEAAQAIEERTAKLSNREKDRTRAKIEDIASGMATLKLQDELAWTVKLEWGDMSDDKDYDVYHLKRYVELYPE